jgi:hypothetical protein
MQSVAVHFPDRLRLHGRRGLHTAIEMAAAAHNTKVTSCPVVRLQVDGGIGAMATLRSSRVVASKITSIATTPKHAAPDG